MHSVFAPKSPPVCSWEALFARLTKNFLLHLTKKILRNAPVACRPWMLAIGHLPAKSVLCRPRMKHCRPSVSHCRPLVCWITTLQQSTNRGKCRVFQGYVCTVPLLIISKHQRNGTLWSKTTNQAFSMHDGQRSKLYTFNKCTKQDSRPLPCHGWSKAMETKEIGSFNHFEYEMLQSTLCSI